MEREDEECPSSTSDALDPRPDHADAGPSCSGDNNDGPNCTAVPSSSVDSPIVLSSDDEDMVHNPEPSAELLRSHLMDADNIGDTVFSKHWLFGTLMKLIEVVEKEPQPQDSPSDSADANEGGLDLEDSLQDEMCKLWDMSSNQTVVQFLMQFKTIDLLTDVIAKTRAPRATEICVGILGNMACCPSVCDAITANAKLRELVLLLLDTPDAPTLVEVTRLLLTCISMPTAAVTWLDDLRGNEEVQISIKFVLQSSTNGELLQHTAELVDKLLDVDDGLCVEWATSDFVHALLEAARQTHGDGMSILNTCLHILQLISTTESGVEALEDHCSAVVRLCLSYLVELCAEDMIILEEQAHVVGSALSIISILFPAWSDKIMCLTSDFQLMRCILKILHVVYPRLHKLPSQHNTRKRSGSESRAHRHNSSQDSTLQSSSTAQSPEVTEGTNSEEAQSSKESTDGTATDCETKENGCSVQKVAADSSGADTERENMLLMYEVLQNLMVAVVQAIAEIQPPKEETSDTSTSDPSTSEPSTSDTKPAKASPSTLEYLNTMCERERLLFLIYSLEGAEADADTDYVLVLKQKAESFKLDRLARIISDASIT